MRIFLSILLLAIAIPAECAYYTTQWLYQDNQNPLYEGGNWTNGLATGLEWSNCASVHGYVHGTQTGAGTGNGQYTDSRAHLSGVWGGTQTVSAVVQVYNQAGATIGQEVELWVLSSISAHSIKGYEVDYSVESTDQYTAIARWDGALGSFAILGAVDFTHYAQTGDQVTGVSSNGVIYLYLNGALIMSRSDATYTSGQPGIGFFLDNNNGTTSPGNSTNFGFTSFTASDGIVEHNVNHISASASLADVRASLNWCVDTDTNTIPAGTVDWGNVGPLVVTQTVAIVGAGTNSLFITNNLADANHWAIECYWNTGQTGLITGITFSCGNPANNCVYIVGSTTNNSRFRVFNCKLLYVPTGFLKIDTAPGVVDHNYVVGNAGGNKLAHIKYSNYGGLVRGNGSWTNTPGAGNDIATFFEDNTVIGTNQTFVMSAFDAQAGARYVNRFEIFTNAYPEAHGSEASYERSTQLGEHYNNYINGQNVNQIGLFWRGGICLVFSNTFDNLTSSGCLKAENNRMLDSLFSPYGGADGRNHWDKNTSGIASGTVQSFSAGQNNNVVTVAGSPYTAHQYIGYTIKKTSGKSISSITAAAGSPPVITVSCTGHGFSNGDKVSIYGANQQEYNTLWTITVVNADSFTAQTVGCLPTSPATGTMFACLGNYFCEIKDNGVNTITFYDSIYGSPVTMTFAANDTFEINHVTQAMDQMGVTGGSLLDSTATPAFPGGWNDQTIYGCYQWSNNTGNVTGVLWSPSSGSLGVGTYLFDNDKPVGYTPFAYPHYLVSPAQPQSTPAPQAILTGPFTLQGPAKIGAL